jgi:hypothetical protein
MSYDILSAITLVDRGPDLLMVVKAASNNVYPRTPQWSMMRHRFENEAAAKGLLFAERLGGGFVFESTLARVHRRPAGQLDADQSRALARFDRSLEDASGAPTPPPLYTVAHAIEALERCASNDYYGAGALALAEGALAALRSRAPVPNPNDMEAAAAARKAFPMLGAVSQFGLSEAAKAALEARPELAKEAGPLGVCALHRLASAYAFDPKMVAGVMDSARRLVEAGAAPGPADVRGQTPLHHAAMSYTPIPGLLKFLAGRGLDIDAADREGNTALHVAALWSREKSVSAILALGADAHLKNAEGKTAAECARAESKAARAFEEWSPAPKQGRGLRRDAGLAL